MLNSHSAPGCIPGFAYGNSICYSGYRVNQSPVFKKFPSEHQITEDLQLLQDQWRYLRLYDCSLHAERVLSVISKHGLDFKVMLGADMKAELSNPNCPWGAEYDDSQLDQNCHSNNEEIDRMVKLAKLYPELVCALSVGNEATVEWSDHLVPVNRLVDFVSRIKSQVPHPVTFCENYVPWPDKLKLLVAELDFISVHTYPVWEYRPVEESIDYTRQNYFSVTDRYPDKPVIITEAGWTTRTNGIGIETSNATPDFQKTYLEQLMNWSRRQEVMAFIFEAFDEPWKGSDDPDEPEKHWGLYRENRTPKLFLQ
ncbi:MAG: exo-beta-1,3-glucanase (GH17 family) [Gammaproteobacteria bacterium]|jgi:exo-beta-1,3-glucanase (GH17 family)